MKTMLSRRKGVTKRKVPLNSTFLSIERKKEKILMIAKKRLKFL